MPLGFVVVSSGVVRDHDELKAELIAAVRKQVGPIATPRDVVVVQRLPKTRSGKILRATMRKIAEHRDYTVPATIEDAAVLDEISEAMAD